MNETKTSKSMNLVLWIAQLLLAVTFIWASAMKLLQPADKLAAMWPWTADNLFLVKFTGVIDFLAALGLTLPALLRVQPRLTIYTACGTILLMIIASIFHSSRGEGSQIGVNIFIGVIAAFIGWGRLKKAPITPKRGR